MKKIAIIALVAFILPAGTVFAERQRAPDFTLTDWSGNTLQFSDIIAGGRPVLLSFSASWCPGCRNKMPWLDRAYRDYGTEVRFVMLGLARGAKQTRGYIEGWGYTVPVYFDSLQQGARAFGLEFIPFTVFIDANGYIVTGVPDVFSEEALRRAIGLIRP